MGELVTQGLTLTMYGMGTVFVFLSLLVAATTLMSSLLQRYAPAPLPASRPPNRRAARLDAGTVADDVPLRAAIAAAVHHHRRPR